MSFRHPYQDIQSERLLLVVLEGPHYTGSEYRHIRATVIRRAVPHKMNEHAVNSVDAVETWNDNYAAKCAGYHIASYANNHYVDDMQLRGQIDVCARPMNNGKPYANQIDFRPHSVCQNTARAILAFYTKYDKFLEKQHLASIPCDNSFGGQLLLLSKFLKIENFVFYKNGRYANSLAEPENFVEGDAMFAASRIIEMLAPFYKNSNL